MANVLDVQDLVVQYGERRVVDGLSFQVGRGKIFGFLGPNGAGKSSTIKSLLGLVFPRSGRLFVHGLSPADPKSRESIGFMPEDATYYRFLTPREILHFYGQLFLIPSSELKKRTERLLELVGLSDAAGRQLGTFSKGMVQKVSLAQALINDPDTLILDEPSTGLDPVARAEVWGYLDQVRRSDGVTVLLTTHLMDEADRCDRVAILDRGKLVACDSPAALKERMGGDVISLSTHDPDAARQLLHQELAIDAEVVGTVLRFERARGHEIVPLVIQSLRGLVQSVSVGKPTLEDVFIHATGHGFRDEQ